MPRLILYIAQSLDGYIADAEGSTQWLHDLPNPDQSDYGFQAFLEGIDTIVMGRKTFDTVMAFDIPWPYTQQQCHVLSSRNIEDLPENCQHLQDWSPKVLDKIKASAQKDIWLLGGAELVKSCLELHLIDEMKIFTMPISLGQGIRLFKEGDYRQNWKLKQCEIFSSGALQQDYLPIA